MRIRRNTFFYRFFVRPVIWFAAVSCLGVLIFRWIPVPFTPLMLIRAGQQFTKGGTVRMAHKWVPIEKISKHLQLAVVCSEDQKFPYHFGFDVDAIQQAVADSHQKNKRLRGASTISQQTAKNVFLWPGRSWIRKFLETWFTVLIELIWSKERILEVYLNSIEMGNGIYGAEAASRHWFHAGASTLTKYQAAALAAILPNPLHYNPIKPSKHLAARIVWIRVQMQNLGRWNR
ncbi:MAG: monofunctional biosynthetic peptidoglycan transglycosylase [Desulforhopalus sp.]